MPFNIGPGELILILVIALVVLGPGKLPDVAQSLGKSIREFRKAATDVSDAGRLDAPATATAPAPAATPSAATASAAPIAATPGATPAATPAAPDAPAQPAPAAPPAPALDPTPGPAADAAPAGTESANDPSRS